jgi:RPA family protein
MAEEFKKRQTAFRVSIGMVLSSDKAHFDEENKFRFVEVKGREIYRINLIANVIDKFESNQKSYINITLDDGTGNIRVKAFADSIHLLQNINLGDSVILVGVLRFYNDELYVMPEIIKAVDPKWLLARKLELEADYGDLYSSTKAYENIESPDLETVSQDKLKNPEEAKQEMEKMIDNVAYEKVEVSKVASSAPAAQVGLREKIIEMIKLSENEGGMDIDKLIMSMKEPVENINKEVTELLEEGSIYEPKPGRLRIL